MTSSAVPTRASPTPRLPAATPSSRRARCARAAPPSAASDPVVETKPVTVVRADGRRGPGLRQRDVRGPRRRRHRRVPAQTTVGARGGRARRRCVRRTERAGRRCLRRPRCRRRTGARRRLRRTAADLRPGARGAASARQPRRGRRDRPARGAVASPSCTSRRGSASALLSGDVTVDDIVGDARSVALGTWSLWVPVVVFFIALLAARRDHQPRPLGRLGDLRPPRRRRRVRRPPPRPALPGAVLDAHRQRGRRSSSTRQLYAPLAIAAFIIGRELTIWFGAWAAARGSARHRAERRGAARVRAHARGGPAALRRVAWPSARGAAPADPVRPLVALAFATATFIALLIFGLGMVSLAARRGRHRGARPRPGARRRSPRSLATARVRAARCGSAVRLPRIRRSGARPVTTAAACYLAYLVGVWFGARGRPARTSPSRPRSPGASRRRGSGWSWPLAALRASAWGGIALVRTRAQRPRWPWEDEFDE